MKVMSLFSESNKYEMKSIYVTFSGVSGDERSVVFSGQVPVTIIQQEIRHSNSGENILLLNTEDNTPDLLDIVESETVSLQVVLNQKNSQLSSGGFGNSIRCTVPENGYFMRVVKEGEINIGDVFILKEKVFNITVITLSDRASRGIYEDLSGNRIQQMVEIPFKEWGRNVEISRIIIPDSEQLLRESFLNEISKKQDIIITTGGTGIGSRDITPETVRPLLDKEMNGIMDFIRLKYGMQKPNALVSRSIAGVKNKTLVYCLPGSVKAVEEYMSEILPTLKHSILMVNDVKAH